MAKPLRVTYGADMRQLKLSGIGDYEPKVVKLKGGDNYQTKVTGASMFVFVDQQHYNVF